MVEGSGRTGLLCCGGKAVCSRSRRPRPAHAHVPRLIVALSFTTRSPRHYTVDRGEIVTNTTTARLIHVQLTVDRRLWLQILLVYSQIFYEIIYYAFNDETNLKNNIFIMTFWLTISRSHLQRPPVKYLFY